MFNQANFFKNLFKLNSNIFLPAFLSANITYYQYQKLSYSLEYPSTKERLRGEYENKIRRYSPPEKIFELFSTATQEDGELLMTYEDLFNAICPYNYSIKEQKEDDDNDDDDDKKVEEKQDNQNDEENKEKEKIKINSNYLIKLADIDRDGYINICEYLIIINLLARKEMKIIRCLKKKIIDKQKKLKNQQLLQQEQELLELKQQFEQLQQQEQSKEREQKNKELNKKLDQLIIQHQKKIAEIKDLDYKDKDLSKFKIDKQMYKKYIIHLLEKSQKKYNKRRDFLDCRRAFVEEDKFQKVIDDHIENFFENKEDITLKYLVDIKQGLSDDIFKYEFNRFKKDENGCINGDDFALSIISYFDTKQVKKYFTHLKDQELKGKFSEDDFVNFHRFLQKNTKKIEKQFHSRKYFTLNEFKEIAINNYKQSILQETPTLDDQIEIFIQLLDLNKNGRIDEKEFNGVIQKRQYYGYGKYQVQSTKQLMINQLKIVAEKAKKIWLVIQEED